MKKVVVFDFDGTLVKGETFFPFLLTFKPWSLLKALPELFLYPLKQDRKRLKEAMMRAVIKGIPYEKVVLKGEIFYHSWVAKRLRKEMLDALEKHRQEGAYLVLVSANIAPILLPIKEKLGFDLLLSSELELIKGKVTGNLSTPNCRGEEKVKRLEPFLEEGDQLEAYGDSEGDRPLLQKAHVAHWVSR